MRRKKLQKNLNLRTAALAPAAPRPVVEMTFGELCRAYIAVVWDGADYRTKKWVEAFGDLSAWTVERDTLERCIADMTAAGYKPSSINRDISQIGSIYKWAAKRHLSPAARSHATHVDVVPNLGSVGRPGPHLLTRRPP